MATVGEMLDRLDAGELTLDEVAADFRGRRWQPEPAATDAQVWGVADDDEPSGDSWAVVNADSRLTPEQYQTLASARQAKPR
jgi:hypothetical protein